LNALYTELEHAGLSIATRRLVHAVLRRALADAVRWDKLARNPAAVADPPSLPRSRAQAWTPRELRRFLEHGADDRLYGLWRRAATHGKCVAASCSGSRGSASTWTAGACASTGSSYHGRWLHVRSSEVAPLRADDRA